MAEYEEDSCDSDGNPKFKISELPPHKIRFSDMPKEHQDIAVRLCAQCNEG